MSPSPEDSISPNGAFVLTCQEVAKVLSEISLGTLIEQLATEIEDVYRDVAIQPVKRMGWSTPPNALEIMGCQGVDLTCIKLISSVPSTNGSPTVTGTLVCTEVGSDRARLICDAAFLTPLRTAVTTGVIMRKVVPGAERLGIAGTGLEGIAHALTLTSMIGSINALHLFDLDPDQAANAATEVHYLLDRDGLLKGRQISIDACESQRELNACDALITATYAERDVDVLRETSSIRDGTFIAAVGADLEKKRELPDDLYARARFIADDLEQCLQDGELQYAKSMWSEKDFRVSGHRGQIAEGRVVSAADLLLDAEPFLRRSEGVTIYDSAGFSGQDLAIARVMLKILTAQNWPKQQWNPGYSRSLVDLLGCRPSFEQSI